MTNATVAIIGGGFCGTLAAIRLLTAAQRGGSSLPFGSRIVLVEPGRAGEGLAYRAGDGDWRLNVPAERMSAFAERPHDFVEWARARDPLVERGDFLARAWYGDYLSERLDLARRRSPRWLAFERVRTRATGLSLVDGAARIQLTDGAVLHADRVLLALGNAPAHPLAGTQADDIVADAWNLDWIEDLPNYVPRVLLVGTGLTMIDIALALADRRPDVRMRAISRHGLLPRRFEAAPGSAAPPARIDAGRLLACGPMSDRLRRFRSEADACAALSGSDWRAEIQGLRAAMPRLWRGASPSVRAQFLRHVRAWWDVHRHRSPGATLARIEEMVRRKRLQVSAARLVGTRRIRDGVIVTTRPRGADKPREDMFDAVVNVTGPDGDPRRSSCPLVQSLIAQGLCLPDAHGLGWAVDEVGRLLGADGRPSDTLFYAGPLLRATYFEASAVPELRGHVDRTATAVAASLASSAGSYVRRLAAPAFRHERPMF